MKIGIDARMYGPRTGGGGPGRYVEQLVLHLQRIDEENEYVVFLKKENFKDCPVPNKRWTKVVADVHWYTLKEQLTMPRIIRKAKLDLVHFPFFNVPLRIRTPFVCTIHDLTMLEQPWSARATTRSRLFFALKQLGFKKTLNNIARRALKIITISEHAKGQIIHRLNVSPERVQVVYNGINKLAKNIANAKQKSKVDRSISLPLKKPYLFNVGNSYPHKNIETLLHAFSFFVRKHPEVSLVLAGPNNVFQERLKREAKEISIPDDRIFFTGFVSDNELAALYKNASMYVLPSKLEGFGIPPLESLQYGVPVAASRASAIPEILEDAAVYFDPSDIESMVSAMHALYTDKRIRTETLIASNDVLAKYKWDNHARECLKIYNNTTP